MVPRLRYDDQVVYPVLKGEAAKGGLLNVTVPQQLSIEFNCLGVEKKTSLVLTLEFAVHSPIVLYFDKDCSKGFPVA